MRKLVLGIPAQASGKNHVAINAFGAPIRPCVRVTASHHCKLDADSVTLPQMTRRRFECNSRPPLALRTTGAQNYLRLSRTTSPRFAFHGWQRWIDNVFIVRLWRSVKYEEVYLHAYESLTQARNGLEKYFEFHNTKRKHQTLKTKPNEVYYKNRPTLQKVA